MSTVNDGVTGSPSESKGEGEDEEREDKGKENDMEEKKQEEEDKENLEYWRKKRQDQGEGDAKEEEVRKVKAGRIPSTPTQAEVEEHLPLHMPYRDWCPVCVAGEGTQNQSRRATTEEMNEGDVPTISMDYCFLTSDDGGDESDPKVLVVHDDKTQAMWALAVRAKGSAPEVAAWVVHKIEEAGYRGMPISLKTDQEESIMALKRSIAVRRESRAAMIESKIRVSKSNPDVERAIRKWRGQFRN